MKMFGLILLFVTRLAFSWGGGDRVGNGGDVVFCSEDHGNSIFILDEYESKIPLRTGYQGLGYQNIVELLLRKLETKSSVRYQFYKRNFSYFKAFVKFIPKKLPTINDSYERINSLCYLNQAAYFKRDSDNRIHYFIQKEIWDKLSEDQKAVLILHELVYTEAAGLGHDESTFVRSANRLLFSKQEFDSDKFDDYLIAPSLWVKESIQSRQEKLQYVHSEKIALFLLKEDLSDPYIDSSLKQTLIMLRYRFKQNTEVVKMLDDRLSRL